MEGRAFSEQALLDAFREAWVSEGFLSREHEERRLQAGEQALSRFFEAEAREPLVPTGVEQEFAFSLGRNKVVGRYDLVVEREGHVQILDFKTGAVDDEERAEKRARESLQLDVYALAHLKTRGRLPDWVELRFLESGLRAGRRPTLEETERTEQRILAAAARIRVRDFPATPSYLACSYCAFREICPHTARGPEAEA
jgi:DNA helicase-2/ATP-dependent DNA helicase PcrA